MSSDVLIFGQEIKTVGSEGGIILQEVDKGKNVAQNSTDIFSVSYISFSKFEGFGFSETKVILFLKDKTKLCPSIP